MGGWRRRRKNNSFAKGICAPSNPSRGNTLATPLRSCDMQSLQKQNEKSKRRELPLRHFRKVTPSAEITGFFKVYQITVKTKFRQFANGLDLANKQQRGEEIVFSEWIVVELLCCLLFILELLTNSKTESAKRLCWYTTRTHTNFASLCQPATSKNQQGFHATVEFHLPTSIT